MDLDTKNYLGYSFREVQQRFKRQFVKLVKEHGYLPGQIVVHWECEWQALKSADLQLFTDPKQRRLAQDVRAFFLQENQNISARPKERLIPHEGQSVSR